MVALTLGAPSSPAGAEEAVNWLTTEQQPDGSWGGELALRDSATVVEALTLVGPNLGVTLTGRAWLANQATNNIDFTARRIVALAPSGMTDAADGLALVAIRNAVEFDTAKPNYPEGGWGIAAGFATDTLDTALALDALYAVGLNGGLGVYNRAVAAGVTNTHQWNIATGSVKARIVVTVTGSTVRLRMRQGAPPGPGDPFFSLPPGTWLIVFPDSGLPFTPGQNYISIQNTTGTPATYTMTASYETPTFDTRRLDEALNYLKTSQTAGGGWGPQRGGTTNFPITLHVLSTLQRFSNYRNDAVMNPALSYVRGQQNPDGSFSDGGNTPDYLTALALRVLIGEDVCAADSVAARDYLTTNQNVNGSWDDDPYTTAQALLVTNPPPPADATGTVDLAGVDRVITRTVTFVITDCDHPEGPSVELRNVAVNFNVNGEGTFTLGDIDSTADWISADEAHVLRRLVAVNPVECTATSVSFFGANSLRAGDLNDDQFIDVEDFAILAIRWNQAGSVADVTGNNLQNQQDLNAMLPNLFAIGDLIDGCGSLRGDGGDRSDTLERPGPKTSVSVDKLTVGHPEARRADINGDGVVDRDDIVRFARANHVPVPSALESSGPRPEVGRGATIGVKP